jgi:hypothetical protein
MFSFLWTLNYMMCIRTSIIGQYNVAAFFFSLSLWDLFITGILFIMSPASVFCSLFSHDLKGKLLGLETRGCTLFSHCFLFLNSSNYSKIFFCFFFSSLCKFIYLFIYFILSKIFLISAKTCPSLLWEYYFLIFPLELNSLNPSLHDTPLNIWKQLWSLLVVYYSVLQLKFFLSFLFFKCSFFGNLSRSWQTNEALVIFGYMTH